MTLRDLLASHYSELDDELRIETEEEGVFASLSHYRIAAGKEKGPPTFLVFRAEEKD